MDNSSKFKGLTILPLIMLITGSIDSIRNFPTTALFGESLIFYLCLAAIIFLIPTALISAQLTASLPNEGGVYQWVRRAFGPKTACLAIWLQWINTMVWFPTMLAFVAGTGAFLFAPEWISNPYYLVSVTLALFWGLTFINLKGIETSANLAKYCALFGLVLPLTLLLLLSVSFVASGHTTYITLTTTSWLPDLSNLHNWSSMTGIMASFLGIELASVHVKQVKNASRTFPRALILSVFFIIATMMLGSLAIAMVLSHDQINLVGGVMQAFNAYLQALHMSWMLPLLTLMLLVGSVGGMISWLISPARGLLEASEDGFLPHMFTKQNNKGVPVNLMIAQALIVSVISIIMLIVPTVNSAYWFLTDLSTQLYMLMYMLMFLAALKLCDQLVFKQDEFTLPGKHKGFKLCAMLGIVGCMTSIIIGSIAPESLRVGSELHYASFFVIGMIVMILPVFGLFAYQKKQASQPS